MLYKIKYNSNGCIDKYKARLIIKGYIQLEGTAYFDTFSPVEKLTTIKVLLSIAAIKDWNLAQLDINISFLHGDIQEKVYMTLPHGHPTSYPSQVYKLSKSLQGLKQPIDNGIQNSPPY